MKYGFYYIIGILLIVGAYSTAKNKMQNPINLDSIRLGMTKEMITKKFGLPSAAVNNQLTYILSDGSELSFTLRDGKVSSAKVKFHGLIKIQDPQMKGLTLVQMQPNPLEMNNPSWFYAGEPSQGLIYKIKSEGVVESLTWVPPFSYETSSPKQLQALLRDFNIQRNM